jgi:hypothetical protein
MTDLVWYACYGSNLARERFLRYLNGDASHLGARDPSPPRASAAVRVDHALGFGRTSARWGGGVAFLHRAEANRVGIRGATLARLWLVTGPQFADVLAQENGLAPGDLDVNVPADGDRAVTCSGPDLQGAPYGCVLQLGSRSGRPVLTFTAAEAPSPNAPSEQYLAVMATGLKESHRLDAAAVAAYLSERAPGWDRDEVARVVRDTPACAGPVGRARQYTMPSQEARAARSTPMGPQPHRVPGPPGHPQT